MAPLARQIESLRARGVDVDVLEVRGAAKLKYLRHMPELRDRAAFADIVHGHYGFSGWLARSQFKKPVVISFMGCDLLGNRQPDGRISWGGQLEVSINRQVARTAAAVIVKSREMASVLRPVESHVVPNGVDMELFRPRDRDAARASLGWELGRAYVLFPADPKNRRKGFAIAQAAVAEASAATGTEAELVALHGVQPATVPTYMNACDVMLLASHHEGSPNVVKEAMSSNLPVVAAQVGDVRELFARAVGYVACNRDPTTLGRELAALLAQAEPTDGRAPLEKLGLDLDTVAGRLVGIYEQVLA